MAEKTGMVNKILPIPPYSTIYQPPLEVAHPWRSSWVVGGCYYFRKRREMAVRMLDNDDDDDDDDSVGIGKFVFGGW